MVWIVFSRASLYCRSCKLGFKIRKNFIWCSARFNLSTLLFFVYGRTHRIGKPKNNGKPRPLIIKFVRYNDRKEDFSSKKLLKDLGVSIMESLAAFRMKKLTNVRETFGFRNVWTVDWRIFYPENGSQHPKIYYNLIILTVFDLCQWYEPNFRMQLVLLICTWYMLALPA